MEDIRQQLKEEAVIDMVYTNVVGVMKDDDVDVDVDAGTDADIQTRCLDSKIEMGINATEKAKVDGVSVFVYLPEDAVNIVWGYVRREWMVFINRAHYLRWHAVHFLRHMPTLNKHQEGRYLHQMIRDDMHFVFARWLEERLAMWVTTEKIIYKECRYANMIELIHAKCVENNAHLCRAVLCQQSMRFGYTFKNTKKVKLHSQLPLISSINTNTTTNTNTTNAVESERRVGYK